jgi:hypothetical protein
MRIRRMTQISCLSLVLVLGLSGALLAEALTVHSFQITSAVQVNNVVVQPGSYHLKISNSTGIAEMVLSQGGKVVAKALVAPKALQDPVKQTSLVVKPAKKGAPEVLQLRVVGDKHHYHIIQMNDEYYRALFLGTGMPQPLPKSIF